MFNVGGGELLAILVIALIVLGPDKLPEAARKCGQLVADFRRISNGFKQELRDAIDLGPESSSTNRAPQITAPEHPDTSVEPAATKPPTSGGTGSFKIDGPPESFN